MRVKPRELVLLVPGTTQYEMEMRSSILFSGSDYAWHLVDEQRVPLRSVMKMSIRAKMRARKSGKSIDSELADEYERLKEGRTEIRGSDGSLKYRRPNKTRRRKKEPEVREETPRDDEWDAIRGSVSALVSKELAEVDEVEREILMVDLGIDLEVLVRQYQAKLRTKSKNGLRKGWNEIAERRKLYQSLRVLGMDAPRPGELPDLDLVNKTYRRVAADCHPDRHPGNPHVVDEFKRVGAAYRTVLECVSSLKEQQDA